MRPLNWLPLFAGLALSTPLLANSLNYNQISLRAEVQQAVNNDTLTVTLFTEEQDSDPAKLAKRVTATLNQGLQTARTNQQIKVSSGNRSSQPVYDEKRENIIAWRERGEIRLESTDFAQVSAVTGELLGKLNLSSMEFSLSAASRAQTEDELIKQAIEAFKKRANIATQTLGGSGYKIVQLNLNTQYMQPRPYLRASKMMSMAADSAPAPVVEGGEADVSVNADGVIEVKLP